MGLKMKNKINPEVQQPEPIPAGLRLCPLKINQKHRFFTDRFCDKDRCALWNNKARRCGMIR